MESLDPHERIFTRRYDRLVRLFVATIAATALLTATLSVFALWPSYQDVGYQPEQPIAFPHDIMAGQVELPCLHCHGAAERGPVAGIPPVSQCLDCHRHVQPRDDRGQLRPMIAALLNGHMDAETGRPTKPIVWRKVHDTSDFAYFDHSRHVVGARLDCVECHGPVETMRVVKRVHSMKMGWCLDCHRQTPEPWRTDGRQTRGPTHCSTCHR